MSALAMKKYFFICISFFYTITGYSQSSRLELYGATGLFNTQLSRDSLVPPDRRGKSRLGDVSSYGLQYSLPVGNKRWAIKGGVGYSVRHYSLNKYSVGDFFTAIFLFGGRPRSDTFQISYLRFTNKYVQVPLSFAYTISPNKYDRIKFTTGLQLRSDFLISSDAAPRFDSSVFIPAASDFGKVSDAYKKSASKYLLTAEPFIEADFILYQNWGMYLQLKPFSFYTSETDSKLTTSNAEFFGFGMGIFYNFSKK